MKRLSEIIVEDAMYDTVRSKSKFIGHKGMEMNRAVSLYKVVRIRLNGEVGYACLFYDKEYNMFMYKGSLNKFTIQLLNLYVKQSKNVVLNIKFVIKKHVLSQGMKINMISNLEFMD